MKNRNLFAKLTILAILVLGAAFLFAGCETKSKDVQTNAVTGPSTELLICPTIACPPDCKSCEYDSAGCVTGKCLDQPATAVCGDAVCASGESTDNCPTDCLQTGTPVPTVGREQERRDMERNIQDKSNEATNMQKEITRCKREAPEWNFGTAETVFADWQKTVTDMKNILSTQSAGGLYNDFDTWLFYESDRHLNDIRQSFWDENNKCNTVSQGKNFTRNIQDRRREITNVQKEFKDIERNGVIVTGTETDLKLKDCIQLLDQFDALLKQGTPESIQAVSDGWRDVDWCFQDMHAAKQSLQDQRQTKEQERQKTDDLKNVSRVIKEKDRMINKDMQRELNQLTKQGVSNAEAAACITDLKTFLAEMQTAYSASDPQAAWDINREIDDKNRDCWDLLNSTRQAQEFTKQRIPDRTREIEDRNRELSKIEKEWKDQTPPDVLAKLREVVVNMESLVDEIRQLVAEGKYDDAREVDDWEFQELRQEWDQLRPQLDMLQQTRFVKRDLKNGLKEIVKIKDRVTHLEQAGRRASAQQVADCRGFLSSAEARINEALTALDKGDFKWLEINGQVLENLKWEGEKMCGFAIEGQGGFGGPDVKGFIQEDFGGQNKDSMEAVLNKVTEELMYKVMERVNAMSSALIDQLVSKATERFQEYIAKTLETASFIPQQFQNELLEKKTAIIDQLSIVEQKLGNMTDKIAEYNFIGEAAQKLEDKLAQVEQGGRLTEAEIDALKQEARAEKFSTGMIPFKDTDDNEWYTRHVIEVKNTGAIQGYRNAAGNLTGEYGPGNNLTNLEWTKIVLELFGHKNLSWPDGYWGKAKELGVTIALQGARTDEKITRAEMLRVLFEIAGEKPVTAEACNYSDSCSHSLKDYIEAATNFGIVSGNPDGTFAPNVSLNRAEAAKIASKVNELITAKQFKSDQPIPVEKD